MAAHAVASAALARPGAVSASQALWAAPAPDEVVLAGSQAAVRVLRFVAESVAHAVAPAALARSGAVSASQVLWAASAPDAVVLDGSLAAVRPAGTHLAFRATDGQEDVCRVGFRSARRAALLGRATDRVGAWPIRSSLQLCSLLRQSCSKEEVAA